MLGRRLFLYDCDEFTRNYYRKVLCIEQKPPIEVDEKKKPPPEKKMPPHDGIGEGTTINKVIFHLIFLYKGLWKILCKIH